MVDKKTSNDALVSSILGIFSDLRTNTRRCIECADVAVYCSNRSVYARDSKVPKIFYCDEHGKMSGIDYEEVDDDDEDSAKDKTNEESPSVDEEIQLRSSVERTKKRERAHSSISTVDDEWENMLPITEGDEPLTSANSLQLINEKNSTEHIVGMSNFRAKHRLRRHSKTNTLVRWKEAIKKVVQLKDPW